MKTPTANKIKKRIKSNRTNKTKKNREKNVELNALK